VAEKDAKPLRTASGQIAFGFFEIIAVVGSDGMSGKAALAMPRPCYVGRAAPSIGLLSALRYGQQRQNPAEVIGGLIDLLRGSAGNDSARKWASGCLLSGECIKKCDYGVNPRFLLAMARVAMAKAKDDAATQRRAGVEGFRAVARDVNALSRLQLDDALLARLGQVPKQNAAGELPDFVFYTGCNVLKTPHIALLALDVMDKLGISYEVMGGPTHCCGVQQLRAGDLMTFCRVAENTLDKLARSKTGEVLSWCPSCQVQFTEMTLPTVEKTRGAKPFDMTPFTLFLRRHLDRMRPLLRERVPMRIVLHRHPGVHGVVEAAEEFCARCPASKSSTCSSPRSGFRPTICASFCSSAARCRSRSFWRPKPLVSTRSRSIIPIIANCARMSAVGRSAS
jgi:heterodisulfide reductase subunit D